MAGWNARLQDDGPVTYEAVGAGNITGGQLVIPSTANPTSDPSLGGCDVAGDAAVNVLGVAYKDAVPVHNRAAFETATTGYPGGFNVVDVSVPDATVVAANDVVGKFTFTTACALGDPICAASNAAAGTTVGAAGKVRKWVSGTDSPAAIIGSCQQPGGVAANGVGWARIRTH
jgi:hypothetical protein